MMVFVRGRAMVMFRVIVSDVLVHVQRRAHGRGRDHGLDEHEGEQTAHAHSLSQRHRSGRSRTSE